MTMTTSEATFIGPACKTKVQQNTIMGSFSFVILANCFIADLVECVSGLAMTGPTIKME